MKTKLAAALSCAALMLALAGCGNDDNGPELDAWSKTVCDTVKPQVQRVKTALEDIAQVKQGEKPAELKTRLSADVDAIAKSHSALADTIEKAGPPPVENGEKLQKDAVNERRALAKSYTELKQQIDDLDTKDRVSFAEDLEEIGNRIEKLGKSDDKALLKLQSGEVGRSMAKQAGCKSVSSSPKAPAGPPEGNPDSVGTGTPNRAG